MHLTSLPFVIAVLSQAPISAVVPSGETLPPASVATQAQNTANQNPASSPMPMPLPTNLGAAALSDQPAMPPAALPTGAPGGAPVIGASPASNLNAVPFGGANTAGGAPAQIPAAYQPRGTSTIQQVQGQGAVTANATSNYQNQRVSREVEVMNFIMRAPATGGLAGKQTRLYDALQQAPAGSYRELIRTYWRLRELTGLYHCALREADYLKNATSNNPVDQERLDKAHLEAAQRVAAQHRLVLSVQRQLAQTMSQASQGGASALPLAADHGVTGMYHTRYETMRSQGLVSAQARQLHEEIAVALVYLQAISEVAGSKDHELQTSASNFTGATTSDLLTKIRAARVHNTAFLRAVRVYNQLIGDYATAMAIPNVNAKMLAEMVLIPASGHTEVARVRGVIRQQSAEVPVGETPGNVVVPAIQQTPISPEPLPQAASPTQVNEPARFPQADVSILR